MKWENTLTPESSHIHEIAYCDRGNGVGKLQVTFKNKKGTPCSVYVYEQVLREDYVRVILAESKGRALHDFIEGKYDYHKL